MSFLRSSFCLGDDVWRALRAVRLGVLLGVAASGSGDVDGTATPAHINEGSWALWTRFCLRGAPNLRGSRSRLALQLRHAIWWVSGMNEADGVHIAELILDQLTEKRYLEM